MEPHTPENNIQLPFAKSHAFLIGINNYEQISSLTTAVNDTNALAEQLEKQHGYQVHPPLLNATKADLLKLLNEDLLNLVHANDRVFFYFAGHGIALDSDDNPKGYLVPADAKPGDTESLISMDQLHQAINALPCQHGMLIMDCCFAGAFKWSTGFRDVVFDLPGVIYEQRFNQYAQDSAWQVITSSASDQKAVDILADRTLGLRAEAGTKHSPFALALLEGLAGEADTVPKDGGDGVITATELYTYLRDRVEDETEEKGKRQSPSMFSLDKHDKGQYIFLVPNHRLNLPPIPKRNPFMGLKSYNESDTNLFYGRDRVIEALDDLIKTNPLVVVSGASGTGKSSVIKAGLLPLLRKKGWQVLPVVRPGKEPLESLKTQIPKLEDLFNKGKSALLIIDQYEELITQCLHPEERIAFEKQLAAWIKTYPSLHIVISIRSDFEPQFKEAALAEWWSKGRYVVPTFSSDELREVIIKPTIQEVLFFEPDALVDNLVDEVNQAPGALPLLSFTLSELYHAYINSGRTNRAFTIEDYEKLGGVIGALRTRANAIYNDLNEAHQSSMRKLMLRMVSLKGGEPASRRVLEEELVFTRKDETDRIRKVADQLVEARLISTGIDVQGQTYFEPAHDALVRAWARLWDWIKASGEEKIALQYKLNQAVLDYQNLLKTEPKKAKDLLWNTNPRLGLLNSELQNKDHGLNALEEVFIKKSVSRRARRQRTIWGLTIAVMAGLILLSVFALNQKSNAQEQQLLAENRLLVSESSRLGAEAKAAYQDAYHASGLEKAMKSYSKLKENSDPTVQRTLSEVFNEYRKNPLLFPTRKIALTAPVISFLMSANEKYLVTFTEDSLITVWDMERYQALHQLRFPSKKWIDRFSPDEKNVLIKGDSGKVNLLNMVSGELISLPNKMEDGKLTNSILFASDNSLFYYTSYYTKKNVPEGRTILEVEWRNMKGEFLKKRSFVNASVNSSLRRIVKKENNLIRIWDLDGNQLDEIYANNIKEIRFTQNGSKMFIVLEENRVLLRDISKKTSIQLDNIHWFEINHKGKNIITEVPQGYLRIIDFEGKVTPVRIPARTASENRQDDWEEYSSEPIKGKFYFSPDGSKFAYFRSRNNRCCMQSGQDEENYWQGPWVYNINTKNTESFKGELEKMILEADFYSNDALLVNSYDYKYDDERFPTILRKNNVAVNLSERVDVFNWDCGIFINGVGDVYGPDGTLIMRLDEKENKFKQINFLDDTYQLLSVGDKEKDTITLWTNLFSNDPDAKIDSDCSVFASLPLFDLKNSKVINSESTQKRKDGRVLLDNNLSLDTDSGFVYDQENQIVESASVAGGQRPPAFFSKQELRNMNQFLKKRNVVVVGDLVYFDISTETSMTVHMTYNEGGLWSVKSKKHLVNGRGASSFVKADENHKILMLAKGIDLEFWDANTSTLSKTFNHRNTIIAGACSKKGDLVLSGDKSGLVRLWTINGDLISEVVIPGMESLSFLEEENAYVVNTKNGSEKFFTPKGIYHNFNHLANSKIHSFTNTNAKNVSIPQTKNKAKQQIVENPPKKKEETNPEKTNASERKREDLIKVFLQAEDSRNFDNIYKCYASTIQQYWHIENPSREKLQEQYEKSWQRNETTQNEIVKIERLDQSTFIVHLNFTFRRKGKEETNEVFSKIKMTFNNAGKIIRIGKVE